MLSLKITFLLKDINGVEIDCPCTCNSTSTCMGITIPANDPYSGQTCYNTVKGCANKTASTQTCMDFTSIYKKIYAIIKLKILSFFN